MRLLCDTESEFVSKKKKNKLKIRNHFTKMFIINLIQDQHPKTIDTPQDCIL